MPKDRWQNETLSNNPFAALGGARTSGESTAQSAVPPQKKPESVPRPKVKGTRLERAQRGGKTVTVVSFHGQPTPEALREWLRDAKARLGTGGAVEDDTVILQGDQREKLKA